MANSICILHSPKSKEKISFHVIFNGIIFTNKGHLKFFMNLLDKILKYKAPEDIKNNAQHIDHLVYTSETRTASLRMYMNNKYTDQLDNRL